MKRFVLIIIIFSQIICCSSNDTSVELYITGNSQGKFNPISHCRCGEETGGLARKITFLSSIESSASFKFEVGNWLYTYSKSGLNNESINKEKYYLHAETYQAAGYDAINVGISDLSVGKNFLGELAKSYGLPFISANLIDDQDNLIFPAYKLLHNQDLRIGVLGIIINDDRNISVHIKPYMQVLKENLKDLGTKTDFIILLADMKHEQLLSIAEEFPQINLVIYNGKKSGTFTGVKKMKQLFYCNSGINGENVIKFSINKASQDSFVDATRKIKDIRFREKMVNNYALYANSDYYKIEENVNRANIYEDELKTLKTELEDINNFFEWENIQLTEIYPEDSLWVSKINKFKLQEETDENK